MMKTVRKKKIFSAGQKSEILAKYPFWKCVVYENVTFVGHACLYILCRNCSRHIGTEICYAMEWFFELLASCFALLPVNDGALRGAIMGLAEDSQSLPLQPWLTSATSLTIY